MASLLGANASATPVHKPRSRQGSMSRMSAVGGSTQESKASAGSGKQERHRFLNVGNT
jgi:hypothetical protein